MTVFFQIKTFLKKKLFPTKKFYFDLNVNIFEAFHQLFVKKNRQNRERRRAVIGLKRIAERASFVYNL